MKTAVVLLSGGQDSTTCLYWAKVNFDRVTAVCFDYGQRHVTELAAAERVARVANVTLKKLTIGALRELAGSALTSSGIPVAAEGGYKDAEAPNGLPSTFVPGRNALFMALAAAHAVSLGAKAIVTGTCQTDYSGYPDCRRDFVDAMERALTLAMPSSAGPIQIVTPLMYLTKAETVGLAQRLPGCMDALAETVTCYHGRRPGCGQCPACELRARGFAEAGVLDPAGA